MRIPSGNCVLIGACVAFLGCTGPYQPVLELWPTSDASSAGAPALQNSSASSSGGSGSSGSNDSGVTSPTPTATSSPTGGSSGGPPANAPDAAQSSSGGSSGGPIEAGTVNPDSGTGGFDGGSRTNGGCNLSVTVAVTNSGGYSPENVGAIWIANSSGTFVKTLERWAQSRISHLTLWNSATSAAGLSRNTVDAITSASLSSYKTHMVSWNCTDAKRAVVPDGAYRVYFETTDDNVTGPNAYVDFTKGPTGFNSSPAGTTHFANIKLAFTP